MTSQVLSHLGMVSCVSLALSGCSGAPDGTDSPKPGIDEAAQPLAPYAVSLEVDPQPILNPGALAHVLATANQDVGPTPYYIEIFETSADSTGTVTGQLVSHCASGKTCAFDAFSTNPNFRNFVAYISSYSTTYLPPNVQATSSIVTAIWGNGGISLSAKASPNPVTFPKATQFSATLNKRFEGSALSLLLWEDPDETNLLTCKASCATWYSPSSPPWAAFTAAVCTKPIDFGSTITDCGILTQVSVPVTVNSR